MVEIIQVPAYARNEAEGGQSVAALHAVLRSLGVSVRYEELWVLCGAAFSFVYDDAPVFEPLRDRLPLDTLLTGTRAMGLNGRWLADQPTAAVLSQLEAALAQGRPAVVSLYGVEGYHGFAVATGYDPQEQRLQVQAAGRSLRIPLPDPWWGAVTGPVAWARCPVFLVEPQPVPGWTPEGRLSRALNRGAALIGGGSVAYRDCEGAREFSGVPLGGRNAQYGLPALDLLAADIGGAEWLGDFALIWRLHAQLGQLEQARRNAAAFFRTMPHPLAGEAHDLSRLTAELAADLRARFWYRPAHDVSTAADVMAQVGSSEAMLFWLGLSDEERARLGARMPVFQTPWGWTALYDSSPRRQSATAMVSRLRQADERLAVVLAKLANAL